MGRPVGGGTVAIVLLFFTACNMGLNSAPENAAAPESSSKPSPTPTSAPASMIFATDFEDVADWSAPRPARGSSGTGFSINWNGNATPPPDPGPPKKLDGSWMHPSSWFRAAPSTLDSYLTPMATVAAGQGLSGSRGMVYNIEASGTWSGGSPLVMYLGDAGYHELYLGLWIKYHPNFIWQAATPAGPMQKLVYISRLNEPLTAASQADNHSDGPLHPSWLPHWVAYISGAPFYQYFSNRSQRSNGSLVAYDQVQDMYSQHPDYYPGGGPFKFPDDGTGNPLVNADGQWHHYEYHIKMNSAPGVADGVQEVWLDGVKKFQKTNMEFVTAGGSVTRGFNYIELFDNCYLLSHLPAENVVYPIYMDEVTISTAYTGPGYRVFGTSP